MLVFNFNIGFSPQWETKEGYIISEEGRKE